GRPDDASAPNYWVRFKDYIKNVACSEIYSTWKTEAIKANVLAILSFTLNRVYTEWYRGKGYDFTITSSTAFDQSFSYGRTIFEEIGVVVDDLFTTYITREGISQPLFTQYCDGRRVQCGGLSQWGSQALGEQGWDAVSILRKYYGSDVYLQSAEKVEGVPLSYGGEVLTLGSEGEDVRIIQGQLNRISGKFPAIPKVPADGIYGPATQAAVTEFQKIFHLPQTGSVDFAGWYEISNVFVAVTEMA
ncbi:MAG: peptidoglycan-binding protein, partial [Oscillospiraceae bacterium]|nr:peptidoglycan-binding protein [Oscillospiraceae bacterium]